MTNRAASAIDIEKAMLVSKLWLETLYGAQYVIRGGVFPCYVMSKH